MRGDIDQAVAATAPSDGLFASPAALAGGRLVVRHSAEPRDLHRLFECLGHEDCVHSWRNIEPEGRSTVKELLEWENALRPTELFFFYGAEDGGLRLVAGGAVAARMSNDFPHPGFCVLSRCYVMPEFRGRGFYRDILQYRLEHCVRQLGPTLRAVHIGTVDARVARAITRASRADWPRFIHLGQERLHVSTQTRTVDDYIMLAPAYVRRLQDALTGRHAPVCVVELRRSLSLLRGDQPPRSPVRDLGLGVKRGFDEARTQGWFDVHDAAGFEELIAFCEAIPLIGIDEPSQEEEESDGNLRRTGC